MVGRMALKPAGLRNAHRYETPGMLTIAIVGVLGVFVYLVPSGSFPVGFDAWWNLHVAGLWAEGGFPERVGEAAFTQFERAFADRQLGFHALLAGVHGAEPDPSRIAPWIWIFALAQLLAVFGCARTLAPRASAGWLLLLPALSATWLFRATALRDMLLAVVPLLVVVTFAALPGRVTAKRFVGIAIAAACFGYVHGAIFLPIGLVVLVAIGRRIDRQPSALRVVLAAAAGLAVSVLARPDVPAIWELLWTLNVRLPLGLLSGDLPIRPSEFAAYPLGQLLRTNWPMIIASLALLLLACRSRETRGWSLTLPVLVLAVGACFGRRLFELAVPFVVIDLARRAPRRPWLALVLLVALPWHIDYARRSADANRQSGLVSVANWLAAKSKPGDVVFVADWGVTSPLAFWTRGRGLRFTGVTDPSLMWAEQPEHFATWWSIKSAADPEPLESIEKAFGARFVVTHSHDAAPGRPAGQTAQRLWESIQKASGAGRRIEAFEVPSAGQVGRWHCWLIERP